MADQRIVWHYWSGETSVKASVYPIQADGTIDSASPVEENITLTEDPNFGGRYIGTHTGTDEGLFAVRIHTANIGDPNDELLQRPGLIQLYNVDGVYYVNDIGLTDSQIADGILRRSVQSIEDDAAKYSLCAVILGNLLASRAGTTLTINKVGGGAFDTYTIATDAAADLITDVS